MKIKTYLKRCILIIVIVIAIVLCEYTVNKSVYKEYESELIDASLSVASQMVVIESLQSTELEYEQSLYIQMYGYYDSLESTENKSLKQMVFCELFLTLYPTKEELVNEREESFVTLYALIEKYPEILEYGNISDTISSIKFTTGDLVSAVNHYNEYVDQYNDIVSKMNNCKYVLRGYGSEVDEIPYATLT